MNTHYIHWIKKYAETFEEKSFPNERVDFLQS